MEVSKSSAVSNKNIKYRMVDNQIKQNVEINRLDGSKSPNALESIIKNKQNTLIESESRDMKQVRDQCN